MYTVPPVWVFLFRVSSRVWADPWHAGSMFLLVWESVRVTLQDSQFKMFLILDPLFILSLYINFRNKESCPSMRKLRSLWKTKHWTSCIQSSWTSEFSAHRDYVYIRLTHHLKLWSCVVWSDMSFGQTGGGLVGQPSREDQLIGQLTALVTELTS